MEILQTYVHELTSQQYLQLPFEAIKKAELLILEHVGMEIKPILKELNNSLLNFALQRSLIDLPWTLGFLLTFRKNTALKTLMSSNTSMGNLIENP